MKSLKKDKEKATPFGWQEIEGPPKGGTKPQTDAARQA